MRATHSGLLRALAPCSFCLAIAAGAGVARAALVEADLDPDDGLLTQDTDTGLVWLDVTATLGLSYDEVEAGEGGWIALGFRHASFAEICDLLVSEGIQSGNCVAATEFTPESIDAPDSSDDGDIARGVQLQTLFGVTGGGGPQDTQKNTDGLYDDAGGIDPSLAGSAGLRVLVPPTEVRLRVGGDGVPVDESDPETGHWLVRAPEPAQAWLFASALGAIGVLRRRSARC